MKNIIAVAAVFIVLPAFASNPAQRATKLAESLIAYQISGQLCHMIPAPPQKRTELSHDVSQITNTGLVDDGKFTPIDYAVLANDAKNINRLIALGYSPLRQFNNPLSGAAAYDAPNAMGALLAAGVSPNASYPDGSIPLLAAVEQDRQALVAELFGAGADPNPKLRSGSSILDYAMPCQDQSLINLLLTHGVKPSSRSARLARKFGLSLATARER